MNILLHAYEFWKYSSKKVKLTATSIKNQTDIGDLNNNNASAF